MRERIAVGISILAVFVLLALSVLFAVHQNPDGAGPFARAVAVPDRPVGVAEEERAELQESDSVAGLRVFRASSCERCHSVAGAGSSRYPLDGVGSRRSHDELRAWTIGAESVQDSLSPSALRAKQRYQQLSADEMRVLLSFMAGLVER